MGKRHQASRRKSYGRRQHEIRERFERPRGHDGEPIAVDAYDVPDYEVQSTDRFGGLDPRVVMGMRFALVD
jgi:hypothetical protein